MKKVITYGTFDLLHYGHIRLLERAKQLGDYLIVGVTADDFDKTRGKINVQQSLNERLAAVQRLGIADEVIVEEYEGQKIDDILRYNIDIFTLGSDWVGRFDYLKEYCQVVYLERTEGISSSELREQKRQISLGVAGDTDFINKVISEAKVVNGLRFSGLYSHNIGPEAEKEYPFLAGSFEELLAVSDAVYIHSLPREHFAQAKMAMEQGKHVLCESPIALTLEQNRELFQLAKQNKCILMDGLKTAYAMAYHRLILLLKGGKIGEILAVDASCTSLHDFSALDEARRGYIWNSITEWGPTAMLPIFDLLGTDYLSKQIMTRFDAAIPGFDQFTHISFQYPHAAATLKVGLGAKTEGELIVTGTKGYAYVPAPWWKTDYFELRYENSADNKRYFYQLDGEGIRYELVSFLRAIENGRVEPYLDEFTSGAISRVMEDFENRRHMMII